MAVIGTDISRAKALLENGGLVAIPTETVYGLAGNCLEAKSVANIFEIKNRPYFDPLIAHFPNIKQIKKYIEDMPKRAEQLAKAFWPGPMTLIMKKKDIIPDIVTSGLESIAVRIPDHPLSLKLLQSLDFPLAAPSANPFGYISPTTAFHVQVQLGEKIDYILDGGPCQVGIESTIIAFEGEDTIIHRLGGISVEDVEKIVGKVQLQVDNEQPTGPGMLRSHYAPHSPVKIGNIEKMVSESDNENIGVLSFQKYYLPKESKNQYVLTEIGDVEEAATRLFSGLRHLDELGVDVILSEFVPEKGLGRAINDRLTRAAAKRN